MQEESALTGADIDRAIESLRDETVTCALAKGEVLYTSGLRGVGPMLGFLANRIDLSGFSAADRIVGKAAAMLFALAGVREVYAEVMSAGAVDAVRNRAGTGPCPMEQSVMGLDDPAECHAAIRRTAATLAVRAQDGGKS